MGGSELKRLAVVFALVAAFAPGVVSAHPTDPSRHVVLDSVTPQLPSAVVIQLRVSVAEQIFVSNPTAKELEVMADTGEPFLRVSADGVFANKCSMFWYQSLAPFGSNVGLSCRDPMWIQVSRGHDWGWFDHRLHASATGVSPAARSAGKRTVKSKWTVKMRYGEEFVDVTGHIEFNPIVGSIVPRLTSPTDPAQGIQVVVLAGRVPGMFVSNTSPSAITVLGAAGEQFLRLGPAGAEVNQHSPTWVDNVMVQAVQPPNADASTQPVWIKVADVPRFGWIDYRLSYADARPPDDVISRGQTTKLVGWSIPVDTASGPLAFEGVTEWVPVPGPLAIATRSRVVPLVSAGLSILIAAGYLVFRRSRRLASGR